MADNKGFRPFHPSTDIAAAWAVVEKLVEHHDFDLNNLMDNDGEWMATIKPLNSDDYVMAKADTAAEAICRAALAAVEHQKCKKSVTEIIQFLTELHRLENVKQVLVHLDCLDSEITSNNIKITPKRGVLPNHFWFVSENNIENRPKYGNFEK
jgi:hypothetical protein